MLPDIVRQKTQVVIVGAGPTGLSMATQLIRFNIGFIILERNKNTTPFSKAIVVQARTLEIFQEINIAEQAIGKGRLTTAMNIFHKGSKKAFLNLEGMGNGLSAFPFALSLEQSKTEELLSDYVLKNEKTIHWRSEFIRFEQNEKLLVYYKDAEGHQQIIESEYLVGCDGAGSLIRHQMGASFEGDTIPKFFYIADVVLNSTIINKDEIFIFLIKKGFILFFPMEGGGHYRVIGILPDKREEDQITFEDIAGSVKEEVMIPISFEKVNWFSTYKVHSRKADQFMNGRCFIAGDAAHIHTPAGGQGMNTGIQDAYNLGWKLAYTIHYKMNRAVLDSYNTERMQNATNLLKTTDRMFEFMTGSGIFWNFIRLQIFPFFASFVSRNSTLNKQFFPLISQIGIAYPDSILTIKSSIGKIKAGDRMPYFIFSDGSNIFDFLKVPAFKILFFGTHNNNFQEQLKEFKFPVVIYSFNEIPKSVFRESEFYILLRPDNHISYIGKDLKNCMGLLEEISGS